MKIKVIVFLIFLISGITAVLGQEQQRRGGSVAGLVLEAKTGKPIEYANIILFKSIDSAQVTGTISNSEGRFSLASVQPGSYYASIQFLGFDRVTLDLTVSSDNTNIDLGTIELSPAAVNLDNVVVEGERSPISYQIDRKVIDVNQMPVSASGNAAEILENVPSITVDIEGNVSLRGSQNFTVLVDGRPSVLDAQDVLQQIPAGSIDNIEIITNPSAKYDAEGTSGIINIILKKTRTTGFGGVSNLNAGLNNKYGGDFLIEYKVSDISANIGLDYNNRFMPSDSKEERTSTFDNVTSYTNSAGISERGRKMFGLRGGLEYRISDNDIISLIARSGTREMKRSSNQNWTRWNTINPLVNLSNNKSSSERSGSFYAFTLNYQKKFGSEEHQLLSELSYRKSDSDEESLTELFNENVFAEGRRSTESGPSRDIEMKLDYTLPLSESSKFEAGYNGELDLSDESAGYYTADINRNYQFESQYSHNVNSDERQHSLYSIYSGEIGNFGYQAGLRGELTYRSIKVDNFDEFSIDEIDFFPGLHTSYKFSEGKQVMASYTRRIHRPHGWSLEPFYTWSDANNIRIGNPSLKSEYIDSYEVGISSFFGDLSFSAEGYYRISNNKIEDVRSLYAENVTLTTFDNIGKDYALGSELMANFGIGDFWDIRLMGNLYNYKIKGAILGDPFSRESFNWNTRLNNILKFSTRTQFQVTFSYNSPSVSAQGTREGYLSADMAVKQDLLNRALSITLQLRNVFGTAKHEETSSGPGFHNYFYHDMESPMVMLNVKFNINNYRNGEDKRRNEENDGEFDEGDEF